MKEWLHNIEMSIPDKKLGRRILYFVSESRDIIQTVVNKSAALQSAMDIKDAEPGNVFAKLEREKTLMRFTSVYGARVGTKSGFKPICNEIVLPVENKQTDQPVTLLPSALYLTDFHVFSQDERSKMVKAFLDCRKLNECLLLISSPHLLIPDGFANEIEVIFDRALSRNDICTLLTERAEREAAKYHRRPLDSACLFDAARDFEGLSTVQINNVLNSMDFPLHITLPEKKHLELIELERRKDAEKDATLRFLPPRNRAIVGQKRFSDWLEDRREDFKDPVRAEAEGTPAPKGVLLCGVPGTGKSAMAREIAKKYEVPLLSFDVDRLKNSKLGESEARLRRYLNRIDGFGSCVLLMDEIEKTFSVNEDSHEVTKQMLGQLLTWMQDRKSNVFLYITANNIDNLPPELLRDGRLSARFFVFMPARDDLTEMLREMLRSLLPALGPDGKILRKGRVNAQFMSIIKQTEPHAQDPLAAIFDALARNARARKEKGETRLPFMTGANLETLVEMTNRRIRSKARANPGKISDPYAFEDYRECMLECAASPEFVPQAQSNMKELVEMWLNAQQRQYQDVSANTLLPFAKFRDGKFTEKLTGKNDYDSFLIEVFEEEITKACKKREERAKLFNRQ